jgi:competence protein ComEA
MWRAKRLVLFGLVAAILMTFVPVLSAQEAAKININQANVEQIAQLERIGPKYAERIVQFRDEHGPFKNPEDIMQVKGIGPKTFELNKDRITVEE